MNLRANLASFLLFAVFALIATPAHADRDAVQFGSRIVVGPNETVHDAVCFFCSVEAQGPVNHDVVVFFGNAHIATHADHDVVVFFGSVRVDPDGSISHDVVNFFGSIHLGENATVGNDVVAMFGSLRAADSATINGNRVMQPGWVLWIPLLILGGIITAIVSAIRGYQRRQLYAAGYYPPPPPPPPMRPQA
jgi:hypothetical protein